MTNKRLSASCFYAFFFCGIVMLTMGSSLPDISSANNLPYTLSGAMLSCFSLGNMVSGIICSLAVLYLGPKLAAVILTLCVSLGMSLLAMSNAPVVLLCACVFAGLGRGSLITFSQSNVSLITDGDTRSTAMLHATFAGGAILAPLMFSALRVIDWRLGLVAVAVLGVSAAGMFACVGEYPHVRAKSGKSLEFLCEEGFVMLSALMFLYLCCEFALNGWLVSYMTHKNIEMNFSQEIAALLWAVMLAGRVGCAWLSKHVSRKRMLVISCAGSVIFFGAMLLVEGKAYAALSVGFLGLSMSGISPMIYASSAEYTNKYPLAMGVLFTAGCTGGTLMPLLTGIVAQRFGFDGGMYAVFGAFVMLLFVSVMNFRRSEDQRAKISQR